MLVGTTGEFHVTAVLGLSQRNRWGRTQYCDLFSEMRLEKTDPIIYTLKDVLQPFYGISIMTFRLKLLIAHCRDLGIYLSCGTSVEYSKITSLSSCTLNDFCLHFYP